MHLPRKQEIWVHPQRRTPILRHWQNLIQSVNLDCRQLYTYLLVFYTYSISTDVIFFEKQPSLTFLLYLLYWKYVPRYNTYWHGSDICITHVNAPKWKNQPVQVSSWVRYQRLNYIALKCFLMQCNFPNYKLLVSFIKLHLLLAIAAKQFLSYTYVLFVIPTYLLFAVRNKHFYQCLMVFYS